LFLIFLAIFSVLYDKSPRLLVFLPFIELSSEDESFELSHPSYSDISIFEICNYL
jgi:hypothetical protein